MFGPYNRAYDFDRDGELDEMESSLMYEDISCEEKSGCDRDFDEEDEDDDF